MTVTAEQLAQYEKNLTDAKGKIAELEREKMAGNFVSGETDEKRLLRSFHCQDVKSLLNTNVCHPKFAHVAMTEKMAAIELKKAVDVSRYYAQIFDGAACDKGELNDEKQFARVKGLLESRGAKELDLGSRLKAFGTTVSTQGAEWIETAISASYVDEYLLEKKVANLFQEIPMPSNPFKLPVAYGSTVARIVAEGVAATDASSNTAAITFDAAEKFVELYNLPEELNEDSAITFLTLGRNQVLDAQLKALEMAIINGDDSGTHMDTNTLVGAGDCRHAWKGLRKLALANTANGSCIDMGGAIGGTKLDEMIAAAGKFSINPRETVFAVSPQEYHQFVALTNVLTVDKFGPMATILSGVLAAYRGIGIVSSEYLFENLNASGVYDGITMTKGALLLVNKTRFFLGRRRPIRIRVAMDSRAEYDRQQLVSYQRADFKGLVQSATEKSVIYGYNVTL